MMLYEGLVKFLKLAERALEQKDFAGSHNAMIRSQEIISHLNETLDSRYTLSNNLSALYDFMTRHLMEANVKKDEKNISEVLMLAEELRDTWGKALKLAK